MSSPTTNIPAISMAGIVAFGQIGGESKSAHHGPVLLTAEGAIPLFVIGDNPFDAKALREDVGKRIAVRGRWRGNTFRVAPEDIEREQAEEPNASLAATDDAPKPSDEPISRAETSEEMVEQQAFSHLPKSDESGAI